MNSTKKVRGRKRTMSDVMFKRLCNIIVLSVVLILLVITCLLLHSKHERELEEKRQVQKIIEQVEIQEHQVQEVQEPAPYVYEPREDSYYEELDLLARIIHCENSNEVDGEPACWKTGSVVLNRMNSANYPDTIEGVLRQPGQYDCLKMLYKEEPTDIEYEVAAELLNSGSVLPPKVTKAAEFVQGEIHSEEGNTKYCYE